MANTSAIRQRAAHTTYQLSFPSCSTGVISRGLTPEKIASFLEKVIRMDYQHNSVGITRMSDPIYGMVVARPEGLFRLFLILH